jgi:hypothetical protein
MLLLIDFNGINSDVSDGINSKKINCTTKGFRKQRDVIAWLLWEGGFVCYVRTSTVSIETSNGKAGKSSTDQ